MKIIKNLTILLLCLLVTENIFAQSRFKKIKKINLKKEVQKYEKDGFKYEKRTGFEAAIKRTVEKEEETDDEGNLANLIGVGIETSFDAISPPTTSTFPSRFRSKTIGS